MSLVNLAVKSSLVLFKMRLMHVNGRLFSDSDDECDIAYMLSVYYHSCRISVTLYIYIYIFTFTNPIFTECMAYKLPELFGELDTTT